MAPPPEHPLLSLPDDEIIQELRWMSLGELLKFSLVSQRCKDLVTSIPLSAICFSVSIDSTITVNIQKSVRNHSHLTFYTEPDMYWGMGTYGRKKKLTAPQSVQISVRDSPGRYSTRSTLTNNGLTMQEWLQHLQDIFNYHKVDCIRFYEDSSQFDIDDIKKVVGSTTDVRIGNTGCHVFNQMILEKFSPIENLQINTSNFPDSKIPERILIQNFVDLQIGGATSMTLDELLLINSKQIDIQGLQLSAKQLNKFIKLWQKGANPQLEYLNINRPVLNASDEEVIMRGIKHQIIPADHKRQFKATGNLRPEEIEGGIDLFRMDGKKATIKFRRHSISALEMFVWFDHCVVES